MNTLNKIKKDFKRIKDLNFVSCTRPNNTDGGIGNTYEDLLGVKENNLSASDYLGFEIKSKKRYSKSVITLFSKSPSSPEKANTYLLSEYGEIRDINFPDKKKLYASVFGNKYSEVYKKVYMRLNVNKRAKRVELNIYNLSKKCIDQVFWTFDDLQKATTKISSLLLVIATSKFEDKKRYYHFNEAEIYQEFCFEKFLNAIQNGDIQFDLRIGLYNSGKHKGKTHDHGSGFRIKRESFKNLYEHFEELS